MEDIRKLEEMAKFLLSLPQSRERKELLAMARGSYRSCAATFAIAAGIACRKKTRDLTEITEIAKGLNALCSIREHYGKAALREVIKGSLEH